METKITFPSGGVSISGTLRVPNLTEGERRAGFVVLHGFGANQAARNVLAPCDQLDARGYVTLRFDMAGCGESGGERGNLICEEHAQNVLDAWHLLSAHPSVVPGRVGLLGSSFGAAVALYASGISDNIPAVVSSGGWGNGERKFRQQHASEEAWTRFSNLLNRGREFRRETGKSLMIPRMEIVPIPAGENRPKTAGALSEFTAETAQSMFDFRPEEKLSKSDVRPLLLLHSTSDSVTPASESIELFRRAGRNTDLHLFAETSHFMLAQDNPRVWTVIDQWLARFFPARFDEDLH